MAKSKRTKTAGPAKNLRTRKAPDRGLIEGNIVDSMDPPNHGLPTLPFGKDFFPLMGLKVACEDNEHNEHSERNRHIFVHERYGEYYWPHWQNAPPSWLDPVLFADMAKKDSKVQVLLEKALKANKKQTGAKSLVAELDRIFVEVYLPWVIARFEKVQPLVAEWLVLNAADLKLRDKEAAEQAAAVEKLRRLKREKKARQKKSFEVE